MPKEIVRVAEQKDVLDFYRLWKICFGDSDAFCDWFFSQRYAPKHSVLLEREGETVSCMQSFPYHVRIRGKEVSAAMLCGVSTHPKERKKGYMGKIFSYEMQHLRKLGCVIAPHTPAVLPSYFSFGHFPVADAKYLECEAVPAVQMPKGITEITAEQDCLLYPLYQRISEKYSGIIARRESDHIRKGADYRADGGKCIACIENNTIRGYAYYYKTEEMLLCVEAFAEPGYYHRIMQGLFALAEGCRFSAKLPPELYVAFPFAKLNRKQKGVMGLCNVSALLEALQLSIPYTVQITDSVIAENNGIFAFTGKKSEQPPVCVISAGHFLQVLIGYRSLEEIQKEVQILDEAAFADLDILLPKRHCYIIDEY